MLRRWLPLLRSSIAILVVLSLAIVLVHWHEDKAGQDCGLCAAHQMPGLQSATGILFGSPTMHEWRYLMLEQTQDAVSISLSHAGRAPPAVLS